MSIVATLFSPRRPQSGGFFMIFNLIINIVIVVDIVVHYSVTDWLYRSEVVRDLSMRRSYLSECLYL